jgi:hypothetical protein
MGSKVDLSNNCNINFANNVSSFDKTGSLGSVRILEVDLKPDSVFDSPAQHCFRCFNGCGFRCLISFVFDALV